MGRDRPQDPIPGRHGDRRPAGHPKGRHRHRRQRTRTRVSDQRGVRRNLSAVSGGFGLVLRAAPVPATAMLVSQVVVSGGNALLLVVVGDVVAAVPGPGAGGLLPSGATPGLVLLGVVLLAMTVGQTLQSALRLMLTEKVSWYTGEQVLDAANKADAVMYDEPEFHEKLSRARSSSGRPAILTQSLMMFVGSVALAAGLAFVVALLHPLLLVLLTAVSVPLLLVNTRFARKVHEFTTEHNGSVQRRSYLHNLMLGRGTSLEVRSYGLEGHLRGRANVLYEGRRAKLSTFLRRASGLFVGVSVVSAAALLCAVAALGVMVTTGAMPVTDAAVGAVAMLQFSSALTGAVLSVGRLYESALFIDDARDFHDLVVGDAAHSAGPAALLPAPHDFQQISVDKVTFTYPGAAKPTLRGVSMSLDRGQVVALVGDNGSGKTTLAKLLCHHYRPSSGRILWDGRNTARMDPDELRESIAVLFQDYGRYLFTAADNIGLGRVHDIGDRDAIAMAAIQSNAATFIKKLPQAYDSQLGSVFGGADLSGGQWQRLALARAFFRAAPLVVLDEPTASLDPQAEHILMLSLRRLFVGRTVLLISHRLTSLSFVDRIDVLHGGRIVESGTHDELLAAGGRYAVLHRVQQLTQAPHPIGAESPGGTP